MSQISLMSTVTLSETRAFEVLSKRTDGVICLKKAIAAVVLNQTSQDLHYSTVMTSGKVEAANAKLPAGIGGVIQPDGELHVLVDGKGRATHEKFYDMANPLTPQIAHETAVLRGLTIPTTQQVMDALKLFEEDVDPRQLPWVYAVSKGKVKPFRCGTRFELPKPAWSSIQVAEMDSALVVNEITSEVYYIGRHELVGNWVNAEKQDLNATDFWNALPTISNDEFNAMIES